MPTHSVLDDDPCPVSDELLGTMYRSSEHGLRALIEAVSPEVRGMLALYCYRRGHLAGIGLAIAASCEEYDLSHTGGHAGSVLYAKSREALQSSPSDTHIGGRRKVTLATGQLLNMVPVDDDIDDEDDIEAQVELERDIGAVVAIESAVA